MIRISLRQLEYFVASARCSGAAKAAQHLGVSQPSISKAIAELEAHWEEQLFVRQPGVGLLLTTAGKLRYQQAKTLLAEAMRLSQPAQQQPKGRLHVGCLSTLAPRYMPAVLSAMQERYPDIDVELAEGDTESLVSDVERGLLDVCVLYDLGLARGIRLEPVVDLWPYVLLPATHRLASSTSLRVSDIAAEPFVLINLHHSREYFLSLFRMADVRPNIVRESASFEMVCALVANGLGVSMLTTPRAATVAADGKPLVYLPLNDAVVPQSLVLAYSAVSPVASPLTQYFSAVMQQIVGSLTAVG